MPACGRREFPSRGRSGVAVPSWADRQSSGSKGKAPLQFTGVAAFRHHREATCDLGGGREISSARPSSVGFEAHSSRRRPVTFESCLVSRSVEGIRYRISIQWRPQWRPTNANGRCSSPMHSIRTRSGPIRNLVRHPSNAAKTLGRRAILPETDDTCWTQGHVQARRIGNGGICERGAT